MRNKIIFIFVLLLTLLAGCDWIGGGENFPPEPDIEHYAKIQNLSTHTIEIERFSKGEVFHTIKLGVGDEWEFYNNIFENQIPYMSEGTDSSNVVYDDIISVWHTKEEVQKVSRSIWLRSSYTGGKVNDKLHEIYYEFTDADYEEAVQLNEGG